MTPSRRRMLIRRRRTLVVLGAAAVGAVFGAVALGHLGAGGSQPAVTQTAVTGSATAPDASRPTVAAPIPTAPADPSATPSTTSGASEATTVGPPDPADPALPGVPADPVMPATVPLSGTGEAQVLTVPGADSDRPGRTVRYTVEAEGGVGVPTDHFAAHVRAVLTDPRGWEGVEGVHFVNVSPDQRRDGARVDVRIILGSPAYVDRGCLPLTMGRLSCHASGGRVLLNLDRWAHGADTYGSDVQAYRIYLVNHEVGHALGRGHRTCPAAGELSPVMVQQTKSLYGCRPWPWPTRPDQS